MVYRCIKERKRPEKSRLVLISAIEKGFIMAILSDLVAFLIQHIPSILLLGVVAHLTHNYYTPGASSVPGPFFAKLSNLWRFIDVANGHAEVTLQKLHQKYGDYVRLGPKVVSVRNLDALKTIYGINKGYNKVSQRILHILPSVDLETDRFLQSPTATCQGQGDTYIIHDDR